MIQFRAVTKKYKNDHYALKNVNLDILSGEFVFIVGASGAGKSTLMKLLYNEERPTSGTVTIGGINIANLSNDKVPNLRRCMGIVFQDYKLLQNMSIYDNVAYVIRTLGISSREINARVTGALKIVGLYDKMHATPAELSGGEHALYRHASQDAPKNPSLASLVPLPTSGQNYIYCMLQQIRLLILSRIHIYMGARLMLPAS